MKTVVIDKSARRITIRRVEGLVNGRNDCQDNELSAVLPPKEDHSSKRKCNVSKICPSSKDIGFTNGVEWKTKAIPLSLHAVTSSSSSADEVQSSSSDPSDGNLSRKLTALERLKNLTFDVPQVRLQPLVSDQAQKARHASGELTGSSTADRSLSESLHGRNKQSFYRRRDRDIHRSLQDGRKRDDVHCAFSSSDHSSHRSGGYRHDQQSSHLRRPRSPIAEPWLPRGYNGCHLPRQNVICSNADFPLFHASVDVAPFRETVFNWEKLPALEFSESDLSACTTTELEVVAKFVLHRRASLARCTAIMADEVRRQEPDEDTIIDNQVAYAMEDERKDAKRKRRKTMKEKRRYRKKLEYEMVVPGDEPIAAEDQNLFSIHRVIAQAKKPKRIDAAADGSDVAESCSGDDFEQEGKNEWYDNVQSVVEEATKEDDAGVVTKRWFRDDDTELLEMENEDFEIDRLMAQSRKGGRKGASEIDGPRETDEDPQQNFETVAAPQEGAEGREDSGMSDDDDPDWKMEIEGRSMDTRSKKAKQYLSPEELALGQLWIHSSKARRDLVDAGFNRYAHNDDSLPDWFVADEKMHCRANLPITKEAVELYKRRQMEINARPIKKVVEAKLRKKRRAIKRMERIKKKAESLLDNEGLTDVEKRRELKKLYKGCKEKRKKVTYVVSKKGLVGKRVCRPAGVKGRFKVVDPRMKKDMRALKAKETRQSNRRKRKRR